MKTSSLFYQFINFFFLIISAVVHALEKRAIWACWKENKIWCGQIKMEVGEHFGCGNGWCRHFSGAIDRLLAIDWYNTPCFRWVLVADCFIIDYALKTQGAELLIAALPPFVSRPQLELKTKEGGCMERYIDSSLDYYFFFPKFFSFEIDINLYDFCRRVDSLLVLPF